jgi:bile acid:Na+ symporter, BASS family
MDLKQIVLLALQVTIVATVFGFGLGTRPESLLYVVRRPGLFLRSLLAVFVFMPLVAIALALMFHFPATVEVGLVALAISPVPPLLPRKENKAGWDPAFALGLMAWLAILSIVAVPVSLQLLEPISGRHLAIAPWALLTIVLKTVDRWRSEC